jgi:hypothetical protein
VTPHRTGGDLVAIKITAAESSADVRLSDSRFFSPAGATLEFDRGPQGSSTESTTRHSVYSAVVRKAE